MSNPLDTDPFDDALDGPDLPSSPPDAALPEVQKQVSDIVSEDELTPTEKKAAIDAWNSGEQALLKIIEAVAGKGVTGRHKKGIAVKKYLVSLNLKARPSQEYQKKSDSFVLTEIQKDYIRGQALHNKPLEITRELFNNPNLGNLSTEYQKVLEFYRTIDPSLRYVKQDEADDGPKEYRPPKTHEQALARINKYVFEGMDPNNLTQKERICLDSLIKYTHVHRYLYMMNEMTSVRDRELLESSFIRFCYDKPDITEEEIDMYINLAMNMVQFTRMQRELEVLIETRDQIQEETGKMPIAIVQELTSLRKEIGDNEKRQKGLYETLQGKRSERMKNKLKENASVVQLVDLWKNEVKRKQLIEVAKVRQERLKDEVQKLATMDDIRFQLWGMGKEEIVNY